MARRTPAVSVSIDGLTEAVAALQALPEAFREVAAASLAEGGDIIQRDSDLRVPVDEGDLKRSQGRNTRDDGLQTAVGYGDEKARWVEFATADTPAQPFLWPAFRAGAKHVRKRMREWAKEAGQKVRARTKRLKRPRKVAT